MAVETIIWIVVAALTALTGLAALWEYNSRRNLQYRWCGHSDPLFECEIMAIRDGPTEYCPDCGNQLVRWGLNRSE